MHVDRRDTHCTATIKIPSNFGSTTVVIVVMQQRQRNRLSGKRKTVLCIG